MSGNWRAALVALFAYSGSLPAQTTAYDSAYFAWQAGHYVVALDGLLGVLRSPAASEYHERIALLTGELYVTTQVAADGRNVQWNPDGRYILYESGPRDNAVTTILAYHDGRVAVARIFLGRSATFVGGPQIAFVRGQGPTASHFLTSVTDSTLIPQDSGTAVTTNSHLQTIMGSPGGFAFVDSSGTRHVFEGGYWPNLSDAAQAIAYVSRHGTEHSLRWFDMRTGQTTILKNDELPIFGPVISPDGKHIVYHGMPREDWELYSIGPDGISDRRLTRDVEHDTRPVFVNNETILAVAGESRHHRSYLYDIVTGRRRRLFHNNTVRTVAPEYEWQRHPGGKAVLIVADRDGDTNSPERGVFLVDLTRKVTRDTLIARLETMRSEESALRNHGRQVFAPLRQTIESVVREVSKDRIYAYARDLYAFDSKHIAQPGNRLAIEYLERTLRGFGYEPELQWFEPEPGVRTANVIATLKGRRNAGCVYVVGSHFDSVKLSAGADDNTSGTTAVLEAARVLAGRPQQSTIKFAFYTGEEAGLLGSREFVRRAQDAKEHIVAMLNNDMIGWRNDQRFDTTIRYSHAGIRDLQHAAAFLFTNLITYDARYYLNTDAAVFYQAYGDVIGGIGSYPILGNPNYHDRHDVLETVDQQLVTEVSKVTVASIVWLANSTTLPRAVHAPQLQSMEASCVLKD